MGLSLPYRTKQVGFDDGLFARGSANANGAWKLDNKFRAASLLRVDTNSRMVGLENLVDDGEAETSPASKARLKRFKEPVCLAGIEAGSCVAD